MQPFDWFADHLDEDDDPDLWQVALSLILAEIEPGPDRLVEVGRCSHWLRPHQYRWRADGGFACPTGYGSGGGGYSFSALPQFDWSVVLGWNGTEWGVVPKRSVRTALRLTIPSRTRRHRQAACTPSGTRGGKRRSSSTGSAGGTMAGPARLRHETGRTKMTGKLYRYVGPEAIRSRTVAGPSGRRIDSLEDMRAWLAENRAAGLLGGQVAATFVIDPEGRLRLADRHSEHVACAGSGPILSAGEMFLGTTGNAVLVEEVSNLSTGYCPEPESWQAVGEALDGLGVVHPGRFTSVVIFRRCPRCGQRNVVKDGWFICQVCGGELPATWNFV